MNWNDQPDDIEVSGKRVLVRVDLNVPVEDSPSGPRVTDVTRMERIAPTVLEISKKGGKVILLSHFDRPGGQIVPEMSLAKTVSPLSKILAKPVAFGTDCVGVMAEAAIAAMNNGDILLLENTRFHPCEEKNNPPFGKELADLGDLFVNDAFSTAHRAHASTVGIASHLPSVAGRAMQAELEALEAGLGNPEHPLVAIVGGMKVSTKLELLANLVKKVDTLVIGGGMANTFLSAKGYDVGTSLHEHDLADTARNILGEAEKQNCEIVLPLDGVVAREFKANVQNETVDISAIPSDAMLLDVGPLTIKRINTVITNAKTLIWNGPLGAFEIEPFDKATIAVAKFAAQRTKTGNLVSVAGGGDTVAALNRAGVIQDLTYVSTAGGAFLEWMEGRELPGVKVLLR